VANSRRAPRFSLPEMADQGVDEAISSFLSGPQVRRGRREPTNLLGRGGGSFGTLETRISWEEALHREAARCARYRRPAAVMVISAAAGRTADASRWLNRVATPIAHAIHRGIRETDLVTRTGDARFQVLMPETTERQARHVAERIAIDCKVWLEAIEAPVSVRVVSAATATDTTLEMALDKALRAIEASRPS
jgi:hypothetical protein